MEGILWTTGWLLGEKIAPEAKSLLVIKGIEVGDEKGKVRGRRVVGIRSWLGVTIVAPDADTAIREYRELVRQGDEGLGCALNPDPTEDAFRQIFSKLAAEQHVAQAS